jgi:hypothetical protein
MQSRLLVPLCTVAAALGFGVVRLWIPPAEPSKGLPAPPPSKNSETATASPQNSTTAAAATPSPASGPTPGETTPAPASPKSILEITRHLADQGLSPAEARLRFMETIASLKAEELAGLLLREAANSDFFRLSRFEFQFIAERLSEIAPQRAAELWLSNASLRFQTGALLQPWASRDPNAFLAWSLSLPPDSQQATGSVLGRIAKTAPEQFTSLAPQIAASPAAIPAARASIQALAEQGNDSSRQDPALSLARSLPEGPMRNTALAELAKWPGIDPATPEIAAAIASLPRTEAQRLGRDLGSKAEQLPEGPARQSAYAASLRQLTAKNPQAAVEKLNALSGQPDYASAVQGFVEETARKDPKSALQWTLSIPSQNPADASQRLRALERTARAWMQVNPEEARAWVENAPLSNQEFFTLTGRNRSR